jgi:predicted MFS family arabinose efflux permease
MARVVSPSASLWLIRLSAFTSQFDRFIIPPMLFSIARSFGATLGQAAAAASLYFLLYGLTQPLWAALSDRIGRIRTTQLALLGATVAGLASAAAPSLAFLIVARTFAGGFFGAVIPTSLVYVGDTVPFSNRQHELANLMAASAVATAVGTLAGGLIAGLSTWRLGFALSAVAALVLAVLLQRVPEPAGRPADAHPLVQAARVLARRWALVVVGIALVEGAIVLGCLTFLAPAVEAAGWSAQVAGLAAAVYGLANLSSTQIVKRALHRYSPRALMTFGGCAIAAGYAVVSASPTLPGAAVAAALVGFGFAFLHSTLQAWATEVVPEARATTISFFAAALFVGSSFATAIFSPLASNDHYTLLFGIGAAFALPLGAAAGLARARYGARVLSRS